jgi:hypothetical protein
MAETQSFINLVQEQLENSKDLDMAVLEHGLRKALFSDGCKILEGLLNQPKALGSLVPHGKFHERRTRNVQCLLGTFELERGYYKTSEGWYAPMDSKLELIGKYTPGLAKMMCHAAGTDGSFAEAEETLLVYAGVKVPASQIRAVAQGIGTEITKWSSVREEPRNKEVPTMYISYDGTGVPMRKEETQGRKGKQPDGSSATRELKLGCVFTSHGFDKDGNPLRDADSTTYVASFNPAAEFAPILLNEAKLRGLEQAQRKVVLGDGALWIWNQASMLFPEAIHILDYYHAKEHLSVLASSVFPDKHKSRILFNKWVKWLDRNKVLRIAKDAEAKLPSRGHRRNVGEREIQYLRPNSKRMMYATFKKEGYFIGSGVIESGCKTVVGKRTKQSGMFWQVQGAQNVLNIRCSIIGNTYDKYWEYRHQTEKTKLAS